MSAISRPAVARKLTLMATLGTMWVKSEKTYFVGSLSQLESTDETGEISTSKEGRSSAMPA